MKIFIASLLIVLAMSGKNWEVVSSLPSCFTGLPFNLALSTGKPGYVYFGQNLPSFASIDGSKGVITGVSQSAGAWPFSVRIIDGSQVVVRQYILNVVNTEDRKVWSMDHKNYYERKVENPFHVVGSSSGKTVVKVGETFNYGFSTKNAVGSTVWAYLNLPSGVQGNAQSGFVAGAFTKPGIYTLAVECADEAGNTAEGFVTVTVVDAAASGINSLNKVTVNNVVPFVFDLESVHRQQIAADKLLFEALALVNEAKAAAANKQGSFDSLNVQLVAAEANADKAAADAAAANTDRELAAQRLSQTNKALNVAEDQLNLALLYQAGAQSNVKKAKNAVQVAQDNFDIAEKTLQEAEKDLREAQINLNNKKLAEVKAATDLQNSQKDFNRANEDLNDAKNRLQAAITDQKNAKKVLQKAEDDLRLAKVAFDQADKELKEATLALAKAESARQAALKVLKAATLNNQKATTALGAAEWDLNQAIAALNVANAAKEAADRTSALVISNGVPRKITKINQAVVFSGCAIQHLPRYQGSVRIVSVLPGRALISTGNTIVFGSCTSGKENIVVGKTVTLEGVINPSSKSIEVHSCKNSMLH